mgnify:CR=1 FL=1
MLQAVYRAALVAVDGRGAVSRALREPDSSVPPGPLHLLAIGKAAAAMAHGAADARGDDIVGGLVITRSGYDDPALPQRLPVRQLTAPHPVPDARSLAAGEALVDYLSGAPADSRFLFLISGGASSLVERLAGDADAAALAALNEWLLASGLDIGRMNAIRKRVSTIKGGRLARWLAGRRADVLLISDVPGDDPAVIGSGLLAPDHGQMADAATVAALPGAIAPAPPAPSPGDALFATVHSRIVASNSMARSAAAAAAAEQGWPVRSEPALLRGEAATLGVDIAQALRAGAPGCVIQGGEPTVTLPPTPGRGGRMQALALAAAGVLADSPCLLLAAGTDGADGPGEDAGALVDGGTLARGAAAGLDAAAALAAADAGRFLAASGDLLQTGATGTNVMDLVIGLKP